ncbi:alpha/beta hydrolase [Aquimarina sp. 2201CG14-23]|uniref:alpha/beta hydrolase n=1 Tax=Aquimarina mycalae TaxID=3040073 RepID=UPI002477F263|nr:alpha/beta hydrolase [Aquimarina sp. 2201CG14-23]MDH7445587.1 alpha/beta hydrolase [Aquimarina sp. 2201CG14-23]
MAKIDKNLVPVQTLLIPKSVMYVGKFLNLISPFLASRFGARIFLTPFKYKRPERERNMAEESLKEKIKIENINREVIVYNFGNSNKKVLLVHGWSGSGTQLSKIADQLLEKGFSTVSFDAPAHGEAPGKRTNMPHFIETIYQLEKTHGPFESAIGHSLGGMSLLRATKFGLGIKKLVVIGTANSITKITKDFTRNLQLSQKTGRLIKLYFDKHYGEDLDNYSGGVSAAGVTVPTLVVHDKDDIDVHYSAAHEITEKLAQGTLLITEKLGHRKILGNKDVIDKIVHFVSE